MNLTANNVYRRKCKKLISVRRDIDGEITTVAHNGCNDTSYSWDQVSWRYVGG